MKKIPISKERFAFIKNNLKVSCSTIKSIPNLGKNIVSDKSPAYKQINSSLEKILTARKEFLNSAGKFTRQKEVKAVLSKIDNTCNYMQSVLEAMEASEADGKMVRSLSQPTVTKISAAFVEMKAFFDIRKTLELPANKKEESASNDEDENGSMREQLEDLKKKLVDDQGLTKEEKERLKIVLREQKLEDVRKEVSKFFSRNRKFSEKLPNVKTDDKIVEVLELPIIGVYKPFYYPKEFKAAGIQVQEVDFYSILDKQIIIGLNQRELKERNLNKSMYLKQVLKSLANRLGYMLIQVSEKPFYYHDLGYEFHWVMDERVLNRLTKNGSKPFKVNNWGFGF